jgi:ribonuclease E
MTFYEAALRVLESAGRPLTFHDITSQSIEQNLLSHVGKTPELTMLSRLLAMARRKTDRKVVVTTKDTFALADWALPEDPEALAQTAQSESRPEDELPPLRPTERHPEPRMENVRVAGRGGERKRRRDEDEDEGRRRKRRYPPISEVAFEILSEAGEALTPQVLLDRARERGLAGEELGAEQVLAAVADDNQRRLDGGRRAQFLYRESGELALDRTEGTPELSPTEIQGAFAAVLGLTLENGRLVTGRADRGTGEAAAPVADLVQALQAVKTAAKDARRAVARALRRRLVDLDAGTLERAVVKVMQALGFRELKVAKRSREGVLLTSRRRDGSLELRYAVRVLRSSASVDRRAVQELRREFGHYGAQAGLIITPGELRADAKSEAVAGTGLVFLWCGEGLADKFLEAEVAVSASRVEVFEIDERFFELARGGAEEAQRRRDERQKEKRRPDEPLPREPRAAKAPEVSSGSAPEVVAEGDEDEGPEGEETEGSEEGEEVEAGSAQAGQGEVGAGGEPRRRRRRRRRGRRARTPGGPNAAVNGEPSAAGDPVPAAASDAAPSGSSAPEPVAPVSAPAPLAAPPPAAAGSGEGNAG